MTDRKRQCLYLHALACVYAYTRANLNILMFVFLQLHLDEILITLSDLAAASDLNIKMAAVMVDKMLKEVVLETDEGEFKISATYFTILIFTLI